MAVRDAETTRKKREVICPGDVVPEKLGIGWMKMRVRKRLTEDGEQALWLYVKRPRISHMYLRESLEVHNSKTVFVLDRALIVESK
jgi:hypothetical protein